MLRAAVALIGAGTGLLAVAGLTTSPALLWLALSCLISGTVLALVPEPARPACEHQCAPAEPTEDEGDAQAEPAEAPAAEPVDLDGPTVPIRVPGYVLVAEEQRRAAAAEARGVRGR